MYFNFIISEGCQLSGEFLSLVEFRFNGPEFLRYKGFNFLLSVTDYLQSRRLNSSRRKTSGNLSPKQRTDLISHQSVKNPPGLLCIHQIQVDGSRVLYRLLHRLGGDFIKHYPAWGICRNSQQKRQMPGYRLSLAVRVGCKIDF